MSNHTYQFTSLENIINQFILAYTGEDKIISKIKKLDVSFHAQRALQELSFDTFKSTKSREITIQPSLQVALPHDYVNYTKISTVDSAGIKHLLYPTSKTSNPMRYQADSNEEYLTSYNGNILSGELIVNGTFQNSENWSLNFDGTGTNTPQPTEVSVDTATLGDPLQGWFYGYNGNAIGGYDLPQNYSVYQEAPIVSGEEYKITYTMSGYTSGGFNFVIVDENGDYTATTERTANGTYSETITASGTAGSYIENSIYFQNANAVNGNAVIDSVSIVRVGDEETSTTWSNYKSATPSENQDDYQDDRYWPMEGERYGLDPQHAQANGSFYIDENSGKIHFSSNVSGKTVTLDYISDGIGTDAEMVVHKFAEEAIYKCIMHGILSTRSNIPEYLVARYKKERFAAIRTAKLRLSNIKLEELTQILRGKSKQIKH